MCQLECLNELGQNNNWFNDKLQYTIRKYRYYKKIISRNLRPNKNASNMLQPGKATIQIGDRVRVRSEAEINQTLNRLRKTRGCTFQIEMYNHSEREYRVFKKVDYFWDEAKQEIRKCNDIFLLEGACCSGAHAYLTTCQRNCFFFWQTAWLEKV